MTVVTSQKLNLTVLPFGLLSYVESLKLQERTHAQAVADPALGYLLWGQHPDVLTLGKNAEVNDIHLTPQELAAHGIEMHRSDRGGKVTLHNPGQLIVYPIINLAKLGLGVRSFVSHLEGAMINALRGLGICAHSETNLPGVWVNDKKIGAVGIRVKNRVSMHGLSLNVCNDLTPYRFFLPCGIENRGITSVKDLNQSKEQLSVEGVSTALLQEIIKSLVGD